MKRAEFITEYSGKALKTIKAIVKAEDLETVKISIEENTLGDTVIVANGFSLEISILRDIFSVVA